MVAHFSMKYHSLHHRLTFRYVHTQVDLSFLESESDPDVLRIPGTSRQQARLGDGFHKMDQEVANHEKGGRSDAGTYGEGQDASAATLQVTSWNFVTTP